MKYKTLFENSPVGLFKCNIQGDILNVNEQMVNLLGAPNEKDVKKFNVNDIPELKKIWEDEFLSSEKKENISGIIEYTTPWDKKVMLKYKVTMILSNKKTSEYIIALSDVKKEKEAQEKLLYYSFHDKLTGLYNRRYFENELERLNNSRKLPISIVVCDLDNLKYINDEYGHKKGDEYIIKVANILKENFRDEDIIARIGGDEFGIILPDTNKINTLEIINRIKDEYKKDKYSKNTGISIGYSIKDEPAIELERALIRADKKLYEDKNSKFYSMVSGKYNN